MPAGMEIRLDAVKDSTVPPPDTFVAMRVGDVQKQSRFGLSRTYRFPVPGDCRGSFGKLEVFKRIGSLTVNLDRDSQECQVPCHYPDFDGLKLNLNVKSGQSWERPATTEKRSKAKQRMDAAQMYLNQHRLEELLADAMREVIRNKPDNPHKFLSRFILDHANDGFLPVVKDAKKSEPEPMPISPIRSKFAPMPVERSLPPTLPPKSPARVQKLPPIQTGEDMKKSLPPPTLQTIPQAPKPSKAVTPAPATVTFVTGAVSPPAWLLPANHEVISSAPPPSQAILPIKTYYAANFSGSVAEHFCAKLFPSKPRPAAEGHDSIRIQLRGALLEATRNGNFERAMKTIKEPPKQAPFKYLPSVGTWCVRNLPQEPEPPKANFKRLPSVGTWLAAAPFAAEEEAAPKEAQVTVTAFRHSPSVGTWLVKKPPMVERPWYFEEVEAGEHTEYVAKLQDVIAEKDLELERLKAQLAALQEKVPQDEAPDLVSSAKPVVDEPKQVTPALWLLPASGQIQAVCQAAPAKAPITNFRQYCSTNMKGAKESLSSVLSLFPSKASKASEAPSTKQDFKKLPSVCTWISLRPSWKMPAVEATASTANQPAVTPALWLLPASSQIQASCQQAPASAPINSFSQYCATNFKGAKESTSSVLSLFPSKAREAPATKQDFKALPSVCTWMSLPPRRNERRASEATASTPNQPKVTPALWLLPASGQIEAVCQQAPASAPISSFSQYCATNFKGANESTSAVLSLFPSKVKKQPAGMPEPPSHWLQRASVGTWLGHRWVATATKQTSILDRSRSSLLRMPQEDLISSFQQELKRKEAEIQELKQNNAA